jgi:hypothetical protein
VLRPGSLRPRSQISARYPSVEKEGGVSERGISSRFCRERIAISKNLVRLRAMGIRSPARALRKGGPPVRWMRPVPPDKGPAPPSPAPPPGHRHRHDGISRRPRPVPSRRMTTRPNLPTMMVRCVVGAVARALTPPSPAPTFRLRDMAAFRVSKHGGALASATRGSAANPDGAVDPRRSVLPSLTALARAVIAFGYTTARGRVDYNQKSSIRPYFP